MKAGKRVFSLIMVFALLAAIVQVPGGSSTKAAEIGNATFYTIGTNQSGIISGKRKR